MKGFARLALLTGRSPCRSQQISSGREVLAAVQAANLSSAGSEGGAAGGGGGGGGGGSQAPAKVASSKPSPPSRINKLCERFRNKARFNDASGAEHYGRQYIQEGGEPQAWMLPMLLSTYGRLRQADKAWAIYQQLQQLQQGQQGQQLQQGQQGQQADRGQQAEQAQSGGQEQQQPPPQQGQQAQQREQGDAQAQAHTQRQQRVEQQPQLPGWWGLEPSAEEAGQPAERGAELQTQSPAGGAEGQAAGASSSGSPAWQARLQQRRARLAAEAARLVQGLRLDAFPMDEYGYGCLITALSRAEHPPYDLPPRYAAMAAQAFADMQAHGVRPNVVVWHNLMACQAKAVLPDEAFATYRAMLASGTRPISNTFSILVSACGRARQPQRAAEVVDRLMPQAGVAPSLPVFNALLGAFGRAGSVDAAYAAWMKMLDSGATPDDCTERVLALAFASHPALAADVVAEARQIRLERGQQQGQGWRPSDSWVASGAQDEVLDEAVMAEAAAAEAGQQAQQAQQAQRAPYRLHWHRQSPLQIDRGSAQAVSHSPLAPLLSAMQSAAGSTGGGTAGGTAGEGERDPGDAQGGLRQLLKLDLHGSSQAAARMVLLRRLETLVLQAPELIAEVEQAEEEWHRQRERHRVCQAQQRERQQLVGSLKRQQQAVAADILAEPGSGTPSSGASITSSSGDGKQPGQAAAEGGGWREGEQRWPELGRQWDQEAQAGPATAGTAAPPNGAGGGVGGTHEGTGQQAVAAQHAAAAVAAAAAGGPHPGERFQRPSLCIITGQGRHSRGNRGGVLKAAVSALLAQQGLPIKGDPFNDGVVFVPWEPLAAYLQQQRRTMQEDHFLSAARVRYLYVFAGAAGLVAAAHLLPRLQPWLA